MGLEGEVCMRLFGQSDPVQSALDNYVNPSLFSSCFGSEKARQQKAVEAILHDPLTKVDAPLLFEALKKLEAAGETKVSIKGILSNYNALPKTTQKTHGIWLFNFQKPEYKKREEKIAWVLTNIKTVYANGKSITDYLSPKEIEGLKPQQRLEVVRQQLKVDESKVNSFLAFTVAQERRPEIIKQARELNG